MHIPVDDPKFVAATQADGWDIRLTCQPPNSPNLNILDLGFFAALQSIFHKLFPGILCSAAMILVLIKLLSCTPSLILVLNICAGSVDDIMVKVKQAFDEYPAERGNKIFMMLQACMVEVLRDTGGNRYQVPHMRKEVLQRLETLPVTLKCTANLVRCAIDSLPDA
jgi:hypothetical protein